MFSSIYALWFLFAGIALIMLGNGLQGTLLGVRAGLEGFMTVETGLIMSAYYLGFLLGSVATSRIVKKVGHIRTFAALASVASAMVLMHSVFTNPSAWFVIRIGTGFCFAGLAVVTESWLNYYSTNKMRGWLFSIYMVVQLSGLAAGQFLLNLSDPGGYSLFILISILVSLAVVPILLTSTPGPVIAEFTKVGIKKLYEISPLGLVGTFGVGIAHGSFLGMGAVYAQMAGFAQDQVAAFMATLIFGGVVLQLPIGRLSDHLDRRTVLTGVSFLATVSALVCLAVGETSITALFIFTFLFGGLSLSLYSLCVSHTNDYLQPDQMVMASGSLTLVVGVGACLGPLTVSAAMRWLGPGGFFIYLALIHGAIAGFAVYRVFMRKAVPLEDQNPFIPLTSRVTPVAAVVVPETIEAEETQSKP
ncbi:MAG: MFS transporter [Candidatus Nitrohelix vancouverensis]|uniref:MFS transporter n=1 Tax=Candidatus Nitrohelix vancouverensis TaxID=2705534 RepID=A0A7T0C0X8_9BACT|nr:MAG: MFS transporter [Candidatus Nitrohelix vancouverensis]